MRYLAPVLLLFLVGCTTPIKDGTRTAQAYQELVLLVQSGQDTTPWKSSYPDLPYEKMLEAAKTEPNYELPEIQDRE